MLNVMEFGNVEVLPDLEIDKDLFFGMKNFQTSMQPRQCFSSMRLQLGVVDIVDKSLDHVNYL